MKDAEVLAAALLWLRNHYEAGDPKLKDRVLKRIDAVLDKNPPKISEVVRFRQRFK